MNVALTTKYRPTAFAEVVGHELQVRSLESALKKGSSRAYLFTGPSGLGKTTLARIAATTVGCPQGDLIEIDGATWTGIDAMRDVAGTLQYQPLTGEVKAVILDEAHALSKPAIQSLLKILEEPPPWVYWFLCTTEPTRLLPTIKTRCFAVDLKPVKRDVLAQMLASIATEEAYQFVELADEAFEEIIYACAEAAEGSPRAALANLALCATARSPAEAGELLRTSAASTEAVALARALVKGARWSEVVAILNLLAETNPETVRHVIRAYVTKVALGAKNEPAAGRALEILDHFLLPFNAYDGVSPLVMACGKVLLGGPKDG